MRSMANIWTNMAKQANIWNIRQRKKAVEELNRERELLIREVDRAQQDWKLAQMRFEYALGEDEVDYAIYLLEAAEKKYNILLKKAKAELGGFAMQEGAG